MSIFARDVRLGLTANPKHLSSKYFYDDAGDLIFQQIMAMPEYYLTRAELEILEMHPIITDLDMGDRGYDIIELGAGDGYKTKVLLEAAVKTGHDIRYLPIDISASVLEQLRANIAAVLPNLEVVPQQGEYFEVLEQLAGFTSRPKLILFLGSNIGNLLHPIAIDFLTKLGAAILPQDRLLVGFDLKKDPATILRAYNDEAGITASFNYNLLHRINRELGGTFDVSQWLHVPVYNPETGTCKSYLMSRIDQVVTVESLGITVQFEAYETIHTEISQKYSHAVIKWLCDHSGLDAMRYYTDHRAYMADYIIKRR